MDEVITRGACCLPEPVYGGPNFFQCPPDYGRQITATSNPARNHPNAFNKDMGITIRKPQQSVGSRSRAGQ